ncbi:hypothetical protein IAF98_02775 [Lactobacillus delbrueckii subsp. lactis]|nr:hypothetical protein [Lactobacillus delbrueckii]MBO1168841.1 hypothetical protein [Lactobacillus delbrueckii subsp. lactis]MBO1186420.1 hypothetical protein [Lactobacillus delbrueckii subsp. lactis]MBO1192722.1 hypothetical protein [Lactobacillus delbrueckii subsp. lactis]MBO1197763.1 hypothetical protein [Lactobacillus delbrueckii subsp. lactis]MCD5552555.1 hypothetical protein [Lactobacillus delbrueckii subsp. lactis]
MTVEFLIVNFKGPDFYLGHSLANLDQAVGDIHTDSRENKSQPFTG